MESSGIRSNPHTTADEAPAVQENGSVLPKLVNPTGLQRAVAATKCGVPRYTRELIASVRELRNPQGRVDADRTDHLIAPFVRPHSTGSVDALWIGHATILLRIGSTTILTDPVFSSRIGVTLGSMTFGLRRVRPAALDVHHLPTIDLVLLSHAHFDHFDRPSLRKLASGPAAAATVVTASHTRRLLPSGFGSVIELPWRRSVRIKDVTISAMRPTHWGARTAVDRHRAFNSYLIEGSHRRVLFAGDTAATDAFDRLGAVDLAIFGIGAYDPWEHAHATPEQVWDMYTRLSGGVASGQILPMHHSTFVLGREPLDEPMQRLLSVARADTPRIVAALPGDVWSLDRPRPIAG